MKSKQQQKKKEEEPKEEETQKKEKKKEEEPETGKESKKVRLAASDGYMCFRFVLSLTHLVVPGLEAWVPYVNHLLKLLTDEEREVIIMRNGLASGKSLTLRQVAEMKFKSVDRIRRMELSSLEIIKDGIEAGRKFSELCESDELLREEVDSFLNEYDSSESFREYVDGLSPWREKNEQK